MFWFLNKLRSIMRHDFNNRGMYTLESARNSGLQPNACNKLICDYFSFDTSRCALAVIGLQYRYHGTGPNEEVSL
jgi:hypothetical protein